MLDHVLYTVRYVLWRFGNLLRRLRTPPDYIVFYLDGAYLMLRQPAGNRLMRWLRPPRASLQDLAEALRAVVADPRVRGVVLHVRDIHMPWAHLDALRDLIKELRAANKRVVVWSYGYDTASYYVATAADEIVLAPDGMIDALGLRRRYIYLADALKEVGLKADFIAISPYKSAGDMYTRSSMSDQVREMANWLADSAYAELLKAIGEGRKIDEQAARALVAQTPCIDVKAKEAGIVDAILSEEDLPAHLQVEQKHARLMTWEAARSLLLRRPPMRPGRYIALLSIEGLISSGYNERPPLRPPLPVPLLFDERAGNLSLAQVARKVAGDKNAAAVVLYIDSRGGSAVASEAMHATLKKLAAKKPLVIAMGAIAASGGYFVSTPGQVIVAQPTTITGSIGVLAGKVFNSGLLERLMISRETITRGQEPLADVTRPFSDEERAMLEGAIRHSYGIFLDHVASSRKMTLEAVDAIGGGRVWTGRQALAHGLVDEMGGLWRAIDKARELAHLDEGAPVHMFYPSGRAIAPLPDTGSALAYAVDGLRILRRAGLLCICPLLWDE